jgi:hypothetical protein
MEAGFGKVGACIHRIAFSSRTVELISGWPILLVDLNDQGQIVGQEYIGVKQFGLETFMRLLRERLQRAFGIEVTAEEAEAFTGFIRSPAAELALSK